MPLFLKEVTPAAGNVVLLEEVKDQLRVEHNEHDVMLTNYIRAAQSVAESRLNGRKLLTQTWDWLIDSFPIGSWSWSIPRWDPSIAPLRVPLSPLQSVTHIKYYDEANAQQTWLSTNYEIDAASMRPRISPVSGKTWPTTYDRQQCVEVRIVVGYGAASSVPEPIRLWIMAAVAEAYKTPELTVEKNAVGETLSGFMNGLLDFYRVPE
jgi:uncharacterized phiE125 gp8 family phage protein